jgi:very-short-patch-repair endonuclease
VSALEDSLAWALQHLAPDLKGWVRQHRYVPDRKFAADFAFPASWLLIEVQGGIFMARGAHAGPAAAKKDMERLNLATVNGWRVLQFGPHHLTKRALPDTLDLIRAALMVGGRVFGEKAGDLGLGQTAASTPALPALRGAGARGRSKRMVGRVPAVPAGMEGRGNG